jgi:uncharacterized protein YidB (DUF937 family)
MNLASILDMGGELIRNNDDDSTTGLDLGDISGALGDLLGNGGGLDLEGLVRDLGDNSLGEIVASWIGSGDNAPISAGQIGELLGSEKVTAFASRLGLSESSAATALSEALPQIVDRATNEEPSLADSLLGQLGGLDGAMEMIGRFFR